MIMQYPSVQILITGVSSAFIAQLLKFFGYLIIKRKINFQLLATTGGMPSAHSAGIVALASLVGFIKGFSSVEFAIATGYALVVMYDAAGLRRAAGKMAATLNKVMDDIYSHKQTDPRERLKELLGHTPLEVFFGAILGVFMAYISYHYWVL